MRVSSRRGHREPQARPGGWRARRRGVGSVDTVEEKTRNAVALCALLLSRDSERPSRAALTLAWEDQQQPARLSSARLLRRRMRQSGLKRPARSRLIHCASLAPKLAALASSDRAAIIVRHRGGVNRRGTSIRGNTVTTSTLSDASSGSRKPRKLDDLDAPEPIYTPSIGLRALWGDFPVVVRVHSGALSSFGISRSVHVLTRSAPIRRTRSDRPPDARRLRPR